jgi:hypothetical protein
MPNLMVALLLATASAQFASVGLLASDARACRLQSQPEARITPTDAEKIEHFMTARK